MNEAEKKASLRRSIIRVVILYFLIQFVIFSAFALPAGFFGRYLTRFLLVSASFHIFLLCMLFVFQDDFRKEMSGELLSSMNMANRITLIRVSTLPTLLFLLVAAKHYHIRYPLLVLVVCIFVTDFLDGYISRKANEVTKVGRMMDSASDYSLLIVLTLVFRYYRLIPDWFLLLVLSRLGLQAILMGILILVQQKINPRTTWMGKVAVASIMVFYSLEVLGLIIGGLPKYLNVVVAWIVAVIIGVSIGDKILSFATSLAEIRQNRRISYGNDKERP
jgi:phosphatidylglycerophosphate synthase